MTPGGKARRTDLREQHRRRQHGCWDQLIIAPLWEVAQTRTVVLLGHEHHGLPEETWDLIDEVVEIPMVGRGATLNVAVAGSLVLYRLAGLM